MEIGISLGSNMGDRLANLREARERISRLPGLRLTAVSPVYETEPVGVSPAYRHLRFLNAVVVAESEIEPARLLSLFRRIEEDMGRKRVADRNAPRPVDIDIIYADSIEREDGDLTLPHPRWAERRFVVAPLADARPDMVLPGQAMSVKDILSTLPEHPAVVLFSSEW